MDCPYVSQDLRILQLSYAITLNSLCVTNCRRTEPSESILIEVSE